MHRLHSLRSYSVYRMMILSYVAILVLSLMFAGIGYRYLYNDTYKHAVQVVTDQLTQSAYIADGYVESIRQSLFTLAVNPHIQSFVYTKSPMGKDDYYRLMQSIQEVGSVYAINHCMEMLFVYVEGIDSVLTPTARMSTQDYYSMYLNFQESNVETWRSSLSPCEYFTIHPMQTSEKNGQQLIALLVPIPVISTQQGTAVAYMNVSLLRDIFESGGLIEHGSLLIEANGQKILTLGKLERHNQWTQDAYGTFCLSSSDNRYLNISVVGSNGWRYHCAISSEYYLSELKHTHRFIFLMLGLELLGGILFSFIIARANYDPLKKLVSKISREPLPYGSCNEYEVIWDAMSDILSDKTTLAEQLKLQKPILRESLLRQLLDANNRVTGESLERFEIFFQSAPFTVVLISLSIPTNDKNGTLMNYSLTSILDGRFHQDARCHTLAYSSDILAMILNIEAKDVPALTREIEQYMITTLPIQPIIGVGCSVSSLSQIHFSAEQAKEALEYALAWQIAGITRYDELRFAPRAYILTQVQEQELMRYLRAGEDTQACTFVRGLFESATSEPLIHIRQMAYCIITAYLRILNEWKIRVSIQDDLEALSQSIVHDTSPNQLCEALCHIAIRIAQTADQFKRDSFNGLGERIMEIIKTSYTDDTLSLTTIAQKLNMNASYLSRVFKQEMGNSFIDVLNCLRLDEARRLLRTTDIPVQEVAERVGYTSASYFIKVFKKHCGKTPNQFRADAEGS